MAAAWKGGGEGVDGQVVDVAVIGAGLAGALLALSLAERGLGVALIAPEPLAALVAGEGPSRLGPSCWAPATAWSYAGVGGAALASWQALQQRHGDLGLVPRPVRQHGSLLDPLAQLAPLAWPWRPQTYAQLDLARLAAALSELLERWGVSQVAGAVVGPPSPADALVDASDAAAPAHQGAAARGWQLAIQSPDGSAKQLVARQVVLAAGAGCRALWPALGERLRTSWAGVLELASWPDPSQCRSRWLRRARAGAMVLPRRFQRLALEQRASSLEEAESIVDPGLVPWAGGALLGQISLVRPGPELGEPPDPGWMEARLRRGLARWDPALAALPGRYRQVPVSFCTDGRPLVGPIANAPGLWVFAGFSGAFFQVPLAAAEQAAAIAACLSPSLATPTASGQQESQG